MIRRALSLVTRACVVLLPWALRRQVLIRFYGYRLAPSARIGFSWVFPRHLVMGAGARFGHLNVVIHLDRVELGDHVSLERGNWITGLPSSNSRHFTHRPERQAAFIVGAHSAITKGHHFDCTDRIEIGPFTTIAGYRSQFLSHSIDVVANRQDAAPIVIGGYCFIGTAVTVIGGARLPDRSVLGAKALLNKSQASAGWLYAGVPARAIRRLPEDAGYFHRTRGFVD